MGWMQTQRIFGRSEVMLVLRDHGQIAQEWHATVTSADYADPEQLATVVRGFICKYRPQFNDGQLDIVLMDYDGSRQCYRFLVHHPSLPKQTTERGYFEQPREENFELCPEPMPDDKYVGKMLANETIITVCSEECKNDCNPEFILPTNENQQGQRTIAKDGC